MKKQFTAKYRDKRDGFIVKEVVKASLVDLTKDLGQKFLFIDSEHHENGHIVNQEISIPAKYLPKLIKLLQDLK